MSILVTKVSIQYIFTLTKDQQSVFALRSIKLNSQQSSPELDTITDFFGTPQTISMDSIFSSTSIPARISPNVTQLPSQLQRRVKKNH